MVCFEPRMDTDFYSRLSLRESSATLGWLFIGQSFDWPGARSTLLIGFSKRVVSGMLFGSVKNASFAERKATLLELHAKLVDGLGV